MANGRDLLVALEASKLRIQAVEEQLVIKSFIDIEKRISSFFTKENSPKEVKEPYEFS